LLRSLALKSYIGVPLQVRDKTWESLRSLTTEPGRLYGPARPGIAEDIAEASSIAIDNARLYAEVREADKRKDEFLATLATSCANPLAPIRTPCSSCRWRRKTRETFEASAPRWSGKSNRWCG